MCEKNSCAASSRDRDQGSKEPRLKSGKWENVFEGGLKNSVGADDRRANCARNAE